MFNCSYISSQSVDLRIVNRTFLSLGELTKFNTIKHYLPSVNGIWIRTNRVSRGNPT